MVTGVHRRAGRSGQLVPLVLVGAVLDVAVDLFGLAVLGADHVLDDEAVSMMVDAGTYFVPTLGLSHLNRGPAYAESEAERKWAEEHPAPPDYAARAVVAAEAHAAGFKKALDAGVPIANGSDLALPVCWSLASLCEEE